MTPTVILPLTADAPQTTLERVGGKGAQLAHLTRAGFNVPAGFLITTAAYRDHVARHALGPVIAGTLTGAALDDPTTLANAAAAIGRAFRAAPPAPDAAAAVCAAYRALGSPPVAVRSSATAEDLPGFSFAGQQDTFLNVQGEAALLEALVACWASLWTARAIGYRARNGLAHEDVGLAVVVQIMVPSDASGVLFTADPVTGRRDRLVIDAILGLGEALVSGQVTPDHYVVDESGRILERVLGEKGLAIVSRPGGGTVIESRDAADRPALPDTLIESLAALGKRIAALYGTPQDVEWAVAGAEIYVLQARPITSLFPLPNGAGDGPLQAYFSLASVQGVFDPLTPLGEDVLRHLLLGAGRFLSGVDIDPQWLLPAPAGRLYINVTSLVRLRGLGRLYMAGLEGVDPPAAVAFRQQLAAGALQMDRPLPLRIVFYLLGVLLRSLPRFMLSMARPHAVSGGLQRMLVRREGKLVRQLARTQSLAARARLAASTCEALFPWLLPAFVARFGPGMGMLTLLRRLSAGLEPPLDVLELTRGAPHNVTTEMDLALWATAQRIRADSAAAAYLATAPAEALAVDYRAGRLPPAAQKALADFMRRYGMRGLAEIDIGRPRWQEAPAPVIQSLQSYLAIADAAKAPDVVFARGAAAAEAAGERLVEALRRGPRGRARARIARLALPRLRALIGLRESPKFAFIRLFGHLRQAFLEDGRALTAQGVLDQADDIFWLRLAELQQPPQAAWRARVAARRAQYAEEQRRRQIPRVLFSNGHAFYDGMPSAAGADGVLPGSPVSPGVVEGVVRVIRDPTGVRLTPGEILVCPGTDPSWTPLFLAAGGLVMEVGGLMTHGSVVAREYGIPAVVGVHEATKRLQTGDRVRVDGGAGTVTILL